MTMFLMSNLFSFCLFFTTVVDALPKTSIKPRIQDGLALTPPMGWNSYNHYSCYPNETLMRSNAEGLVELGLRDVGYYYVTTDCGWASPNRTANGTLSFNATNFPSGAAIGQYFHSLGLGFGVYSDAGIEMCNEPGQVPPPGSLYHETTDADTFSGWGADLIKYDNCYSDAATGYPDADYTPSTSPSIRYANMTKAIQQTGREMVLSICEWGVDFPSDWAPALGNTWRITNDIIPEWTTIYRQVNQFVPSASFAGPGQWPDLDMLEVGNNVFTEAEEQTHFSLWAIAKSPLIIGAPLKDPYVSTSASSLAIMSNPTVIGFNQDALGKAANLTRRYTEEGFDVWAGPLSDGRTVAALVNWNNETISNTELNFPDFGIQFAGQVLDVWNNITVSEVKTSYTTTIGAHGILLLELSNTTAAGTYEAGKFAEESGNTTQFSNVYGITNSDSYTLVVNFCESSEEATEVLIATSANEASVSAILQPGETSITTQIALLASSSNTVTITTSMSVSNLEIINPTGTFLPSTSFTPLGDASLTTCSPGTCIPVGSKIGYLAPNGSATITIPRNTSTSNETTKYIELIYTNNDVAFSTSWTTGRNARNITIAVNDNEPVRLEVPLSGRHSELFSPGKGWYDSATLGVLVPGFGTGTANSDTIVIGNVNGDQGVQAYGADFVGLTVLY